MLHCVAGCWLRIVIRRGVSLNILPEPRNFWPLSFHMVLTSLQIWELHCSCYWLSVSIASCERSFSKLKLILTYPRVSMSQSRLNSLVLLSIEKENETINSIDFTGIIDESASMKARRVHPQCKLWLVWVCIGVRAGGVPAPPTFGQFDFFGQWRKFGRKGFLEKNIFFR